MRYEDSKLKIPEKCDFYAILNHLNKDISNYKGLLIENTIGSCYLESSKFYKPHSVDILNVIFETFKGALRSSQNNRFLSTFSSGSTFF